MPAVILYRYLTQSLPHCFCLLAVNVTQGQVYVHTHTHTHIITLLILSFWIFFKQLYNELHICFETTKSNEAVLRQSVVNLQDQLFQKEQENIKLKEQLKGSQEPCSTPESESHHSAKVRDFFKMLPL